MAGASDLRFACACGTVTGHIKGTHPKDGLHIACSCRDCAAADVHFGKPKPGPDGVHIYWITPDRVVFDTGLEHLAVKKIYKRGGVLRWYASCCDTPLLNGQPTRSVFICGIHPDILIDTPDLGPVRAHAFKPKPGGGTRHQNSITLMAFLLGKNIPALLSGRVKENPFFDPDTKELIRTPTPFTAEERQAAGL